MLRVMSTLLDWLSMLLENEIGAGSGTNSTQSYFDLGLSW